MAEEDLILHWTLQPDEHSRLNDASGVTRLGLAILFKFFQFLGRFPRNSGEVPAAAVEHVARQVGVPAMLWSQYKWHGRTMEYHRARIRFSLGFREPTLDDGMAMTGWLTGEVGTLDRHRERLTAALLERYRSQKIEPPAPDSIERMVRSAVQSYDSNLCETVWESARKSGINAWNQFILVSRHNHISGPGRRSRRFFQRSLKT